MKFLLGTKQYMTQTFDTTGRAWPATVILAGPVTVTHIKTKERDGYTAVQVGFSDTKENRLTKAVRGHLKASGGIFRHVAETRTDPANSDMKVGDSISATDLFVPGQKITVSAISKGKGFQGVVKRHGFAGGPRTHGQKHSERAPGSIGTGGVQRVLKGTRMAGRMGGNRVTVKNLRILEIDPVNNLLLVAGAVPGRQGTLVELRG